jgi:predicted aspartyl protease
MGISFPVTSKVVLADSRTIEVQIGVAYLRIGDRESGVIVAAMDVPKLLMGSSALEVLGLKVDPVTEAIEASRPFGPAALAGELIR